MQPALILGMILSFAFVRGECSAPADAALARLAAIGASLGAVVFLAQAIAARTRRLTSCDVGRPADRLLRFRRLRAAHFAFWVAVVWCVQSGLEWPRLVCCNWGLGNSVLLDELLLLVPALLPLAFSQVAFTAVETAFDSPAGACRQRSLETAWLLLRHVWSPVLVPVLVLSAGYDVCAVFLPDLAGSEFGWCVWALPAAGIVATFPLLLRLVWDAEPLPPGPLRRRLEHTARQSGLPLRRIYVWHTRGRITNAAVVGLLPSVRSVFLSDGLLCRLDDRQVEAVFAHELGHVRHRHALRRIALVGTAAFGAAWVAPYCPAGIFQAVPAALFGVTLLAVLGWYSRRLEHQADLHAVRILCGTPSPTSDVAVAAAERLIQALDRLVESERRGAKDDWLHPSVARRAAALRRATGQ